MDEQRLDEQRRCAVVTGGSRGIGRAVAVRLAADGFDIAFCSRARDVAAKETIRQVLDAGARCFHAPCDVSCYDEVRDFMAAVETEVGPPHALVTSAGIIRDKSLALMSPSDWQAVIDTNLTGTFNACRAAVLGMVRRRAGAIVNISSVVGLRGNAAQTNYGAAKAGIDGLSRSLAKEVAGRGIRVNTVAPGFIETDMVAGLSERTRAAILAKIPLNRFGTAESVASVVAFLVSDRADYITGQVIQVDGGIEL
jgi:3-oxoacyl-[acyl-carrier protein] reductase